MKKSDKTDTNTSIQEKTPPKADDHAKESFICIDNTGLIYSLTIEQNHIRDGQLALPEDILYSSVRAMDFKRELMIFGDSDGSITRFNARTKQTRSIQIRRSSEIRKIRFSPAKESLLIIVQFVDCVEVLDASSTTLDITASLKSENSKLKVFDSFWVSHDKILIHFSNHTMRVYNITNSSTKPSANLFASVFKSNDDINENLLIKFKNSLYEMIENKENSAEFSNPKLNSFLTCLLEKEMFEASKLEKLSVLSTYFNPRSFETKFWSLLLYKTNKVLNNVVRQNSLLMDFEDFREQQKETLRIYRDKCNLNENVKTSVLVRDLFLINELDSVFNLLIETEAKDDNYSYNLIKASLISTFKNSNLDTSTRTSLKLVGTNLIANGKLFEGIEILCLIGLVFDACRYLQDNNQWAKAAWLAKMRLNEEEYIEVIKRWCDNVLCSNHFSQKEFGILLLVSCKQYLRALEILSETSHTHLSFLFLKYCLDQKFITCSIDLSEASNNLEKLAKFLLESDNKTITKVSQSYLELKSLSV